MAVKVKSYEVVIKTTIEISLDTLILIVESHTNLSRERSLSKIHAIKELRDTYRTKTGHTISLEDAKDLIELAYAQIQNN